ncbi:hypothetical protein M3J09_002846 [Ascochyta lentis]
MPPAPLVVAEALHLPSRCLERNVRRRWLARPFLHALGHTTSKTSAIFRISWRLQMPVSPSISGLTPSISSLVAIVSHATQRIRLCIVLEYGDI